MAERRWIYFILALIVITLVLFISLRLALPKEEEQDPFSMSLVETGREANGTDGNLTDVTLWVAVSHGRPRPSWEGMEVRIETGGGSETLSDPSLAIQDLDGNGRVTEGDLLLLWGLGDDLSHGRVVLFKGARTIGSVEI